MEKQHCANINKRELKFEEEQLTGEKKGKNTLTSRQHYIMYRKTEPM